MQWTRDVSRLMLPNGLTVLVQRDPSAPVVAVVTHVRAGYFDEPDEWVGIAHVLEHMYFKGTARRGPGAIARETQEVGGYINAGTIYDKTVYYTVLPTAGGGLERAVDVQADALMHSAIDPEELGRELEVIIQEAKRKLDNPSAVTSETLYELLFERHRMRRWRIGTEAELRRLGAADVRGYYESRYTPDRVVLAVVGDVVPDDVLRLVESVYGAWSRPRQAIAGSPEEPAERRGRVRVLRGDVERPLASLGWRTVGSLHDDTAALDVAATMLGSGRGARLYGALREPGLAASASAYHYTPTDVGVFALDVESEPVHLEQALRRATGVVADLGADGPSGEELDRARALLTTAWARRLETMDGRATALCEAEALGDFNLLDEILERTLGATAADVRDAVGRWLTPDALGGVVYLPDGAAPLELETAWPPTADAMTRTAPVRISLPPSSVAKAVPSVHRLPEGLVHWEGPNLDLLVRPKPGSRSVSLLLQFPGVPLRERTESAGTSWLLARSAVRGAGGMDGQQLALNAELCGGAIGAAVSTESLGWSMTVAPDALTHAAQLLRAVATEPALTAEAVAVERDLQASDARRVRDDMFRYPLQRALAVAFPSHAYGLPALGNPAGLAGMGADEVREWAAIVRSTRPVAVVVGDVKADAALAALTPLTGWDLPEDAAATERAAPAWQPGADGEDRNKQQSALTLAFPAPPSTSPDRFALAVIGTLLSGLAGRLFDELRERRSLAYTVAAMPWLAKEAGAVLCYIATSPEREAEAREAMLAELRRLTAEPPDAAELGRAGAYAAGIAEIGMQSGRGMAGTIMEAWRRGDIEEWAAGPARLRAVTLDDVLRVAAEVFEPGRVAEFVVRGQRPGS